METKLDPFGVHELLDRTSMISYNFSEYIYEHPLYNQLPKELQSKIEFIEVSLAGLYQDFGNLTVKNDK